MVLSGSSVADHVSTGIIDLADDVKEEGLDVVVQRLVVEEELGEEAKILAIDALMGRVDLKDGDVMGGRLLAIDLRRRRRRRRSTHDVTSGQWGGLHDAMAVRGDCWALDGRGWSGHCV